MRVMMLTALLGCVGLVALCADEPPKKLTTEERKELEAKWTELYTTSVKALAANQLVEAQKSAEEALALTRKLYPKEQWPDGHTRLATSIGHLGNVLRARGRYAEAETLLREAVEAEKRLTRGQDGPLLARTMNRLALLYAAQGKYAAAEPILRDVLAMWKRMLRGQDHPEVVSALHNLGGVLRDAGKYPEAEQLVREGLEMLKRNTKGMDTAYLPPEYVALAAILADRGNLTEAEQLLRDAVAMYQRLTPKRDKPEIALALRNLAAVLFTAGKHVDAETTLREASEMNARLYPDRTHPEAVSILTQRAALAHLQRKFPQAESHIREALKLQKQLSPGDHPKLAGCLNDAGQIYYSCGNHAEAETAHREALNMRKRLFKGDNRFVAESMLNLGSTLLPRGKHEEGMTLYRDALRMYRALVVAQASTSSEGDALTLAASQPFARSHFLYLSLGLKSNPATVYREVFQSKGSVGRVAEQLAVQARAATDPKATAILSELQNIRRRRADLLLAPTPTDTKTAEQRDRDLEDHTRRIQELEKLLRPLVPALGRIAKLDTATPDDLQKALPADAVFVDIQPFRLFEEGDNIPAELGQKGAKYTAFVVTKDRVHWIDLNEAAPIEKAVSLWREAITTPPFAVAADLPAKVRELVWAPVRKHLPAGTKVVYVCPDAELTKLPWAAIPGDKPGTILLEEFAIATVPHAPFLLDSLWPQDKRPNAPTGFLAVGGVAFSEQPQSPKSALVATRGELPIDPKQKLEWADLPGAKAEAEQIVKRAAKHTLETRLLSGADATSDRVLAELPKAKYALIATHGFFADKQFRSVLQIDPKDYEMSRRGERIGIGAKNPMVMSGLVFAGANLPKTPGRGIVTGEALIDRDLSGLELAVLSACETGLGDVAGGEGVFGLQRAFHVAGTRNVVASLWKVNDQATAALMGEFYRQLWDLKQPPIEALRQAQLAVYRANPKDFKALALRGVGKGDIKDPDIPVVGPPLTDGKTNPPALWAAFSLSGIGR